MKRGWSRWHVAAALAVGVPLLGVFCVVVQRPLWAQGHGILIVANLLVALSFYVTAVFVGAEPGHRITGAGLLAAAFLWPMNWINEWHAGPLPLIAALEGPFASLLAVWALMRYPAPWSRRRDDVLTLGIVAVIQAVASLPVLTSLPQWHGLPPATPWLAWWPDRTAYAVTQGIYNYGIVVVAVVAVFALTVRLARLTGPDREVMRPVVASIIVAGILTAFGGVAVAVHRSTPAIDTLYTLENVALIGVPVSFVIASARRWLARERVPELIRQLGFSPTPTTAQDALRRILDDPGVRLLYRIGDSYVDVNGVPQPPWHDSGSAVVAAQSSAASVVLVTTAPVIARYRDVVHAAARAVALALENTSLQAAISAQIHDVAASAHRLSLAVEAERRSVQGAVTGICRHDLAPIAAQLRTLGDSDGPTGLADQLAVGHDLLARAEVDLIRLGAGLGPTGLTDLGLSESVTAAARRLEADITVSVSDDPLDAGIQAAAYFVLSELMTNAVKHAPGAAITVYATLEGPDLVLDVVDNGPGGADLDGSGLRGVAERVADLSGSLAVHSRAGHGTNVLVRLPAGSDPAK